MIRPTLDRIGELWSAGEAHRRARASADRDRARQARSLLNGAVHGTRGRIVLACVPEERHECGLLALAVLLHADGWQVVYLGADTPLENAFELAKDLSADAIGLSATMAAAAEEAERGALAARGAPTRTSRS